jgi:hypothetical protein
MEQSPVSVSRVSPDSGPLGGGNSATLTGSGLGDATSVRVNGVDAAFKAVDNSTIDMTLPPGPDSTKRVLVEVFTPEGRGTAAYTYAGKPSVKQLSQSTGRPGTEVIVDGSNFIDVSSVYFGDTAAPSFTVDSPDRLRVTVPSGAGNVDITVAAAGGRSDATAADRFTVLPA